jgi:hypothetical protein
MEYVIPAKAKPVRRRVATIAEGDVSTAHEANAAE